MTSTTKEKAPAATEASNTTNDKREDSTLPDRSQDPSPPKSGPAEGDSPAKAVKASTKEVADTIMNRLLASKPNRLVFWNGRFYRYVDGVYVEIPKAEEEAFAARYFQKDGVLAEPQHVKRLLLNLQGVCRLPLNRSLNSWLGGKDGRKAIVARNGIICLDELDEQKHPILKGHTPQFFALSKLPYDYDPKATCPKFLEFLEQMMKGDKERILLLQQWAGYLFLPSLGEQKFLICYGSGANGKGVFTKILEELVGPENCSHVSLHRFGDPFALYSTLGKLLNSTSESGKSLTAHVETILKAYVAGDRMTFEQKYRDPIQATPTAKVMICTNELPAFTDSSEGIWRRVILLPWEVAIPPDQQDKKLVSKLREELPGILNWALDGMRKLEEVGGFIQPKKCVDALSEYRIECNSAVEFLKSRCQEGSQRTECKYLYETYETWCEDKGVAPVRNAEFGKAVRRVFPRTHRKRLGGHADRAMFYVGIMLKPKNPPGVP